MGNREKDLQQLAVGNLRRIVGDLHRFGVTGGAAADHLVMCGGLAAAGESGDDVRDALQALKDRLNTPEAAAGKDRGLFGARRGHFDVLNGIGKLARGWAGEPCEHRNRCDKPGRPLKDFHDGASI